MTTTGCLVFPAVSRARTVTITIENLAQRHSNGLPISEGAVSQMRQDNVRPYIMLFDHPSSD